LTKAKETVTAKLKNGVRVKFKTYLEYENHQLWAQKNPEMQIVQGSGYAEEFEKKEQVKDGTT